MATSSAADRSVSPARRRELERIANKSKAEIGLVSFVFGPLGYAMLGKWPLAVLCLVTLNWCLLGFLLAPLHTRSMIGRARSQLDAIDAADE